VLGVQHPIAGSVYCLEKDGYYCVCSSKSSSHAKKLGVKIMYELGRALCNMNLKYTHRNGWAVTFLDGLRYSFCNIKVCKLLYTKLTEISSTYLDTASAVT